MANIISYKYKFIFVHIPKTAGTSIASALQPYLGPDDELVTHTSILDIVNEYNVNLDDFFKFSFVRNPWDRLVSSYFYFSKKPSKRGAYPSGKEFKTWDDFIERLDELPTSKEAISVHPQHWWLMDEYGNMMMDYIARFENLEDEFRVLCKKFNIPRLNLNIFKMSDHGLCSSYYNDETKEKIAKLYQKDIELFDYSFDDVKPGRIEMEKPLISVAVACYNSELYIRDTIKSVVRQTYPNWELIIVDDCSTDNSLKAINGCIHKFGIENKTKVFTHDQNYGYGRTLRDAVANSTGELVVVLDSDDALSNDDTFEIEISVHKKYPHASMTYSDYILCDKQLTPQRPIRTQQMPPGRHFLQGGIRISHLKVFKKALYDKTEGIDPNIRRTVDKDLFLKLEEVGRLIHIDKELYYFRSHPAQLGSTFPKREWKANRDGIYERARQRRKKLGRKDLL